MPRYDGAMSTVTLNLPPSIAALLTRDESARRHLEQVATLLFGEEIPRSPHSLEELMRLWQQEDARESAEEGQAAEEELVAAMNASRAANGEAPLF